MWAGFSDLAGTHVSRSAAYEEDTDAHRTWEKGWRAARQPDYDESEGCPSFKEERRDRFSRPELKTAAQDSVERLPFRWDDLPLGDTGFTTALLTRSEDE